MYFYRCQDLKLPLIFTLYLKPLSDLLSTTDVNFHFYADDIQLWADIDLDSPSDVLTKTRQLEDTFLTIKTWMTTNKLLLNADKTECLIISSKYRREPIPNI